MPGGRPGIGEARPVLHRLAKPFNRGATSALGVHATPDQLGPTAMPETFESALQARVDGMVDACTRCGKCVEVCPVDRPPAGGQRRAARRSSAASSTSCGIGEGNEAARKWANACVLSGECIKACDYGVNPRFLLGMARVAMAHAEDDAATQRRKGVEGFRKVARDVNALSRLQLDDALLARLGQGADSSAAADDARRISCSTPAATCSRRRTSRCLRSTSWMRSASPMRSWAARRHCCGIVQMRAGDVATSGRFAENTLDKLAQQQDRAGAVVVPVAATCSSPRRRCRRSRRRAAQSRSR